MHNALVIYNQSKIDPQIKNPLRILKSLPGQGNSYYTRSNHRFKSNLWLCKPLGRESLKLRNHWRCKLLQRWMSNWLRKYRKRRNRSNLWLWGKLLLSQCLSIKKCRVLSLALISRFKGFHLLQSRQLVRLLRNHQRKLLRSQKRLSKPLQKSLSKSHQIS